MTYVYYYKHMYLVYLRVLKSHWLYRRCIRMDCVQLLMTAQSLCRICSKTASSMTLDQVHLINDELRIRKMFILYVYKRVYYMRKFTTNKHTLTSKCTEVEDYLARSGIHRVCVGHKPIGDSPIVIATSSLEVM